MRKPSRINTKDEKDSFGNVRLIKKSVSVELSYNLSIVLHLLVHYFKFLYLGDNN